MFSASKASSSCMNWLTLPIIFFAFAHVQLRLFVSFIFNISTAFVTKNTNSFGFAKP